MVGQVNKSRAAQRRGARRPRAAAPEGPARERLLEAALEVFAERGFEGARTRDIAERAGANLGLLSYYFGDKHALWREAVARAFGEMETELAAIRAEQASRADAADERAELEALLRGLVRFLARRPAFMQLMNDESRRDGPRMRWLVEHHVRRVAAAIADLAARARARGLLPDIPAAHLHYILLGAAGLFFSHAPECRVLTGLDPSDPRTAEAHADALVALLLRSG